MSQPRLICSVIKKPFLFFGQHHLERRSSEHFLKRSPLKALLSHLNDLEDTF